MGKIDVYRETLKNLDTWQSYLLGESRLPGPRANLELAFAVALEGSADHFLRWAALSPEAAPVNTPREFLVFCGVLGLGYLIARGEGEHFERLREHANDPRWRVREAVALGLQKFGGTSPEMLLDSMRGWSRGSLLERRAVVAALCEPALLANPVHATEILDLLDAVTASLLEENDRRAGEFRVLRKTLGYGWSVPTAVWPELGKPRMEKWVLSKDKDIRWIMKQNLKKNRLQVLDPEWVSLQLGILDG